MFVTDPPTIPPCCMDEHWGRGEHLLLWVRVGHATVRLATGIEHHLSAGEGLWVPAKMDRSVRTVAGSLAIPTWVAPADAPGAPDEAIHFSVPKGWQDWLIQHYAHMVAPLSSFGYTQSDLLTVLDPASNRMSAGPDSAARSSLGPRRSLLPPLPKSGPAQAVALELLRSPTLDHTVEEWAALTNCAPRTLQRDFVNHAGMNFARWRTLCRLAIACDFLEAGYEVGQVAARTGFASRNGFSRAFRTEFAETPLAYARRTAPSAERVAERIIAADEGGAVGRLLDKCSELGRAPTDGRALVGTRTAPRVNNFHVLTWIYKGTGHARVGATTYNRRRGDTIWLPAGFENQTGSPEGSLGLPVGTVGTDDLALQEPLRTHFPASWDNYLLYCSVSGYTQLRPTDFDPGHIIEIFSAQMAANHARSLPMPKDRRARSAAIGFLQRLGSSSQGLVEIDRCVHAAFREEVGLSFASWQHAARMSVARELLAGGASPKAVANRVGYTHVSNFSRAFAKFHNLSPRAYVDKLTTPDVTSGIAPYEHPLSPPSSQVRPDARVASSHSTVRETINQPNGRCARPQD